MIVMFSGHSDARLSETQYGKLIETLENILSEHPDCTFFFGDYGNFDYLCERAVNSFKKLFPDLKTCFVTPYLDENYYKLQIMRGQVDDIIYPPIEDTPKRYAIIARNRYMVDKADLVIAYVTRTFGGASATYLYAKNKSKNIINIGETI